MEYGKVAGIDKPVSRIVFGGDRLRTRRVSQLPARRRERRALELLDRAIELGCNAFDTARVYGDSERTLGAWIRRRRIRDEVVVISKGCHPDGAGYSRLAAQHVSADLHASLKALGTDYIDLYLLHYDDPAARIEAVLERLNRHVEAGEIAAIGASNWSHQRIAAANAAALSRGWKPLRASSVQFSLADWTRPPWPGAVTLGGDSEHSARQWYAESDLPVFAWSSLARGFFSQPMSEWAATYFGTETNNRRRERARDFAHDNHITVAQVALAYVLSHPLRVFAVVGCTTEQKLADDIGAMSVKLDEQTLHWLSTGQR
ncbi:aldo/keto reductase [Mycolicibacterium agri]|uniref:Aldo/keto reductase n=1 Tax=Mycolicibacterium agri TaxID=36811 RepID=A0A2A7NHJ4_MYCAG|nr:aldo/keto reductase [Mycolicibacterium agri]PEG43187.1 aldo/keto reductase [Mycolicibacterium agri]GFG54403.1 aldo/keto reductase [Mycolicibacterium agri]